MGVRSWMRTINTTVRSASFFAIAVTRAKTAPARLVYSGIILGTNLLTVGMKMFPKSRKRKGTAKAKPSRRPSVRPSMSHNSVKAKPVKEDRKLRKDEFRDDVSPYDAYDFNPVSSQPEPEKPKQTVKEVDKLAKVAPDKLEALDQLRREGLLEDKGSKSLLEGLYQGDNRFKDYFARKEFEEGLATHWDEANYTLKIMFPTQTRVTLLAKEEGIYSPDGKMYYVYGGTGDIGDRNIAFMKMIGDYPIKYSGTIVDVLAGYEQINKK